MTSRISQLTAAATLTGTELVELSQLSASVTKTATTISADSTDNSYNDSGNGFVTAGFTTGKSVKVSGFTGNVANNITSGVVTSVAAGKIIIGGTDGDVIVTDAAGESVTITQWDSKRSTAQDVADLAGVSAGREVLSADRTYYVRTDGSDSNNGLANTSGGAFLTIQKAVNLVASTLDLGGHSVTINVADGTYTAGASMVALVGGTSLTIQGNSGAPANVLISTTGANCFTSLVSGIGFYIKDMKLTTATSGSCLAALNGGLITFGNINFGTSAGNQIDAQTNGAINAASNYSISGGAPVHCFAGQSATLQVVGRTITITGTPSFSVCFAGSNISGLVFFYSTTFSGSATGKRYDVSLNAVIYTNGGGANYFPGNSAGSAATGGQYA